MMPFANGKQLFVGAAFVWISILGASFATAQSAPAAPAHFVYCGKTLKGMILFENPDFQSKQIAQLECGETISVLWTRGSWSKVRTQSGLLGYEPTWFVGPLRTPTLSKSGKCNRPSPLDNVDQFDRLSAILDRLIDAEGFTPQEFQSVSREDTEQLAADSYFAAYLTAENPRLVKDAISSSVIEKQVFGKDFASLSPIEQINVQVWLQKVLIVLSKAIDLGIQDGSKYPCSPK